MIRSLLSVLRMRRRFPESLIPATCNFILDDFDAIHLEGDVRFGAYSEIIAVRDGGAETSVLFSVGSGTYFGAFANIRAVGGKIVVGRNVQIAQHVSLIAANHLISPDPASRLNHDAKKKGVEVASGVWIGCNTAVLPGVAIGALSVIGAGAIVTKSVPEREVWAGNPARFLRTI